MPDWAKLAEKGKEYSNKGIDKGKKAYGNSRSAPTNKEEPFKPPKEPPAAPSPQTNRPVRQDIAPPPLRPDSSRSSTNQSPGLAYAAAPRTQSQPQPSAGPLQSRGSTYATPSQPPFRGRAAAQANPRLPMREDLPQYPGKPSNMFRENKDQFFSFLDDYFAANPPKNVQASDEPTIPTHSRPAF